MEVQIFGRKSCSETRKAERFFKERRVRIHAVDLDVKPASRGELRRFAERYGVEALLDRGGKAFRSRGLHAAHLTESRILSLLEEDPGLLRTPLVRSGSRLAIGFQPEAFKEWLG
jgi:arsenate reductase (glutaredoxin)